MGHLSDLYAFPANNLLPGRPGSLEIREAQ